MKSFRKIRRSEALRHANHLTFSPSCSSPSSFPIFQNIYVYPRLSAFIRGFPHPLSYFLFSLSYFNAVIVTPTGSAIKADHILHQQCRRRWPFNLEKSHAKSFKTAANIHLARYGKL
jgi:hypothetical protein